jgi:hypothetical protein
MTAEGAVWTLGGLVLAVSGVSFVGILSFADRLIPGLGTLRAAAPEWVTLAVVVLGAGLVLAGATMTRVGRTG